LRVERENIEGEGVSEIYAETVAACGGRRTSKDQLIRKTVLRIETIPVMGYEATNLRQLSETIKKIKYR
jgi:hypothetical protein